MKQLNIAIGKDKYVIPYPKLRKFLQIEDVRSVIREAITSKAGERLADAILKYLVIASDESDGKFDALPWYEIIDKFFELENFFELHFTIPLVSRPSREKIKDIAWDYPERTWYMWANIFSKAYGWSLEYVAQLELQDAFSLLQEIQAEDQLEKEWQWSLTEIAYPYNAVTKQSNFKPLERPVWMMPVVTQPKVGKILKRMMPMGNVVRMSDENPKL